MEKKEEEWRRREKNGEGVSLREVGSWRKKEEKEKGEKVEDQGEGWRKRKKDGEGGRRMEKDDS